MLIANGVFAGLGYVGGTSSMGNQVWAFDTNTNSVTALVTYAGGLPTLGFVNMAAFTPDGSACYVCDQSGSIFVIDPLTNEATHTVNNMTGQPAVDIRFISFSPDGQTAYAVNNGGAGDENVFVIDVSTGIANSIVTGASFMDLRSVAISPDGTFAYIADFGTHHVYVVDTTSNAVTGTVSVTGSAPAFNGPTWIQFSPDGTYAYVTDGGAIPGVVYRVESATHSTSQVITMESPTFTNPFATVFSPDGTKAYVGDYGTSEVYAIDTTSNEATGTVNVGSAPPFDAPDQIAYTQDGSTLYIADEAVGALYVVNPNTNTVTQTLSFASLLVPTTTEAVALQPLQLLPPTNLSGTKKINHFGLEYEICTLLYWTESPSSPSGYNVYRNGQLIGSVAGSQLSYAAHNTPKTGPLVFAVTAVSATGAESSPATFTVRP